MKCGAILPPATRERNPELERELVGFACRGVCDPEPLLDHMQGRSGFSSTVRLGPDWLLEGREEAADFSNYLVWWLEANPEHPEFERKLRALTLVAEAHSLCLEED